MDINIKSSGIGADTTLYRRRSSRSNATASTASKVDTSKVNVKAINDTRHRDKVYDNFSCQDKRLYPHLKLYSEGRHRPLLRGVFHVICVLTIFPYWIYHIVSTGHVDALHEWVGIILVFLGAYGCFITSSLYHCVPCRPSSEIFLQRLGKTIHRAMTIYWA